MKNLKGKVYKNLANVFMAVGTVGAVTYSFPWYMYEPKVPNSILVEENSN